MICDGCSAVEELRKTPELPDHVFVLRCNWCMDCEDTATDYYYEWWNEEDNDPDKPFIPWNPNQLYFPFLNMSINVFAPSKFPLK